MSTSHIALLLIFVSAMTFINVSPVAAVTGEVLSHQKISATEGGFTGILDSNGQFGRSVAPIGDVNSDGVVDIAVGAPLDNGGGYDIGVLWILLMNSDGTVDDHQKIGSGQGGFAGTLNNSDYFGVAVESLGDMDGDGEIEIAVGAFADDTGGSDRGAVWILFLNDDGTVEDHQKIADMTGGFTGLLSDGDRFGSSISNLGDLDGDGTLELAVGAFSDDDGGLDRGAVWILSLNAIGSVVAQQKISDTSGLFDGILNDFDSFGISVAAMGDLDRDGVTDLAVGARNDDDGGSNRGAVWVLFLNSDGTVKSEQKISDGAGDFSGLLMNGDYFGKSVSSPGDLDGDAVIDLAVGAFSDDDGGLNRGAVWVLFLHTDGTVKSEQKISDLAGGFTGQLDDDDYFGIEMAFLEDLGGNAVNTLLVGADHDDDGGPGYGAVWLLSLDDSLSGLISADLTCSPETGTVPFVTSMNITMRNNYIEQIRRISGRVDALLANGQFFPSWRAGFTNVGPGADYTVAWNLTIPALGTVIGDNDFSLVLEDVTPSPYNQPPYPPAGDTETAACTVTGIAP